jgi:hypothetical protein
MTEDELRASILEDLRILGIEAPESPAPLKPHRIAPKMPARRPDRVQAGRVAHRSNKNQQQRAPAAMANTKPRCAYMLAQSGRRSR